MSGAEPLRLIVFGAGGVGSAVARLLDGRGSMRVVGVVDTDPAKIGRDAGTLAGLAAPLGVPVAGTLDAAIPAAGADVAIHASVPRLEAILDEVEALAARGLDVVSVAGIFYVGHQDPAAARRLDACARRHGVSILAAGATPGFFPDTLPLFLTGACESVERIAFSRVVDMAQWGTGLYPVYGIGLAPAAFEAEVAAGRLKIFDRLAQSRDYLAAALGWTLDGFAEERLPRVAPSVRHGNGIRVASGRVCGFTHRFVGREGERERVRIDYSAVIGIDPAEDGLEESTTIEIDGVPSARYEIRGPIVTDPESVYRCTAAQAVNAVPRVVAAPPGLLRREDLPFFLPVA